MEDTSADGVSCVLVNKLDSLSVSEVLKIVEAKKNFVTRIAKPAAGNVFLFYVQSGIYTYYSTCILKGHSNGKVQFFQITEKLIDEKRLQYALSQSYL